MKVKFLTAIWGARYIDEFARISLPSYLAPGNLPFVAAETDLEVVILTSAGGDAHFNALPIMAGLKSLCSVRFIFIDDLIATGNYGVTLTLAYARGIMDSGTDQTNTHFVFMNSDFVLADDSLRTLIAKLRQGHPCVMAPSLRASAETTMPALGEALTDQGQVLAMPPRAMVRLAFDNLHPTVIGKTVTQEFVSCSTHNQIYWQVDDNTLLARHYLIFMLAIRPEVPMGPVNSYCDYGFVPELVPSGTFSIIDDSDEFFMLELQPASQERQFLRCGRKGVVEIAAELSQWTTKEHRKFAEADIVFRTGERPPQLPALQAQARSFMQELQSNLETPAKDHVDHYYWVSGVQAWILLKFRGKTPILPPEIAPADNQAAGEAAIPPQEPPQRVQTSPRRRRDPFRWYSSLIGGVKRSIGVIPDVPVWHHLWLDSRLLLDWVKSRSAAPSRLLLLCDEFSSLSASLPKHLPMDVLRFSAPLGSRTPPIVQLLDPEFDGSSSATDTYDHILIHIRRAEVLSLRKVLALAERHAHPQTTISVFIEHRDAELDGSNFSFELAQYADIILPSGWIGYRLEALFAGGKWKRRLRILERKLYPQLWPPALRRLPNIVLGASLWVIIAALTALHNLTARKASSFCPDYCTSVLLSLSRGRPSAEPRR